MVFKTFKNGVGTLRASKRVKGLGRTALEAVFMVGLVAAIESLGRYSEADFHDLAIHRRAAALS